MEKGLISVDRWTEGSQVYFLTHLHSDHTQGLSSAWARGPLFCSRLTAKLFPFKFPGLDLSLIRVLNIGSWHSVSLISPSSGEKTVVEVMAIDAHHCPGKSRWRLRTALICRRWFCLWNYYKFKLYIKGIWYIIWLEKSLTNWKTNYNF